MADLHNAKRNYGQGGCALIGINHHHGILFCAVPGCSSTPTKQVHLSFHRLPLKSKGGYGPFP